MHTKCIVLCNSAEIDYTIISSSSPSLAAASVSCLCDRVRPRLSPEVSCGQGFIYLYPLTYIIHYIIQYMIHTLLLDNIALPGRCHPHCHCSDHSDSGPLYVGVPPQAWQNAKCVPICIPIFWIIQDNDSLSPLASLQQVALNYPELFIDISFPPHCLFSFS